IEKGLAQAKVMECGQNGIFHMRAAAPDSPGAHAGGVLNAPRDLGNSGRLRSPAIRHSRPLHAPGIWAASWRLDAQVVLYAAEVKRGAPSGAPRQPLSG